MISNIICFVCGKTGVGKSFLLNYILHKEYQLNRRGGMVILDLRGDHLNLLKEPKFKYTRISGDILNNYDIDWKGILTAYPYLIIEPYKITQEDYQNMGNQIALALVDIGNRIFVLEEAQLCFSVYDSIKKGFGILVTTGRKLGLDFYFTSQRPGIVNTTAVAEANIRIAFSLDDINDLQRMKSIFSETDLTQLKRFEFVAKNTFNHKQIKSDTNHLQMIDDIIWS